MTGHPIDPTGPDSEPGAPDGDNTYHPDEDDMTDTPAYETPEDDRVTMDDGAPSEDEVATTPEAESTDEAPEAEAEPAPKAEPEAEADDDHAE